MIHFLKERLTHFAQLSLAVFAILVAPSSLAAELKAPQGDVLLTVTGQIDQTNVGDTAQFDFEMLQTMPVQVVTTSTPWTDGVVEFSGVALSDLLNAVDAKGNVLKAQAINGYIVDVPVTDAKDVGPILSYKRDGQPMSVRDKGPLWLIYPFDSLSGAKELYFNRSIWQLREIEVLGE